LLFSLERFCITGLHGIRHLDVRFDDNRLVLVGENGTGKSTFAKIVFYTLTRQWPKLRPFSFESLELRVNGADLRLGRGQIMAFLESRARLHHLVPRWRYRHVESGEEVPEEFLLAALEDEMGHREARQLMLKLSGEEMPEMVDFNAVNESLKAAVDVQVLFLPTYRRIEQDLKAIFPGLESDIAKYRERQASRSSKRFIELVEFGMEDVERMIVATMDKMKDFARAGLSNLMGAYLRDVIRGYPTVDIDAVRAIDTTTLTSMIERIDEATLPTTDKRALLDRVAEMKTRGGNRVTGHDSVVADFLLKVYALYREQQAKEGRVREFVRVSNSYLNGKRLVYDDRAFVIFIETSQSADSGDSDGRKLELKMLSSGEKQIVSLFAHIYLSETDRFFVIIDEPELSLSVEWQRTFLPDIMQADRCAGLIAATHSPFVWENALEPYVHSLTEFLIPANVIN
jgi:predicted ATPase